MISDLSFLVIKRTVANHGPFCIVLLSQAQHSFLKVLQIGLSLLFIPFLLLLLLFFIAFLHFSCQPGFSLLLLQIFGCCFAVAFILTCLAFNPKQISKEKLKLCFLCPSISSSFSPFPERFISNAILSCHLSMTAIVVSCEPLTLLSASSKVTVFH